MLFQTSPSLESSILFDIHPTCSSDEYKCKVKCFQGPSLIVSSALSDLQFPRSARGHTLRRGYLSQLIAVIKQWESGQVVRRCRETSSHLCCGETAFFLLSLVTQWFGSRVKGQRSSNGNTNLDRTTETSVFKCWKWNRVCNCFL